MIETKDLLAFMDVIRIYYARGDEEKERISEIVARLRAYDKLKEGIERLCRRLSNRIDKRNK